MREIKFRAWDKTEKRMRYLNHPHWTLCAKFNGEMEVCNLQNGSGGDEYELMQFTGLRDKNGKDGFHKDIINHPSAGTSIIEWFQNGWKARSIVSGLYYEIKNGNFEIIGNKYENPELLKAQS